MGVGMGELRAVDDRDAEIAQLKLRVSGLENEVQKWRSRAYYAEGAAREAEETICPMAQGDPHRMCILAEAMADTLSRAVGRDPTLSDWLEEDAALQGDADVSR